MHPTSCYSQLYETLKGIQQGRINDTFGWTEVVKKFEKSWDENGVTEEVEVNSKADEVRKGGMGSHLSVVD